MNVNYDELIILTGGAFFMVFGIGKQNERKKLLTNGIKAEGVVFDIEKKYDPTSSTTNGIEYWPIIRYVTAEKEWVTKKYDISTNPSYYDIGDKVKVVYDPADIEHFILDDRQTQWIGPLFIIVGVALIIGVIIYFFVNQFPKL